jgi:hypothetical protein
MNVALGMTSRRAWMLVVAAAVLLGVIAMIANTTSLAQTSGQADGFAAARKTFSKLVNAGAVWGGLSVLAGWLVSRPAPALLAGVVAPLIALVVHYGLGDVLGLMPWADFRGNREWFVAAGMLGPGLGIIGAVAARADVWALLGRLVVPLGAVAEPLLLGWLPPDSRDISSNRVSDVAAGLALMVSGLVAAGWLIHTQVSSSARGTSART